MRIILLLGILFVAGCGKKAVENEEPNETVKPKDETAEKPKKQQPKLPVETWAVAGKETATVGRLKMDIIAVSTSMTLNGETYLVLFWGVTTDDENKKYEDTGLGDLGLEIRDEHANKYKMRIINPQPTFGNSLGDGTYRKWLEKTRNEAKSKGFDPVFVASGVTVTDMPVRGAKKVFVSFDGRKIGVNGRFRFEVPREMWEEKPRPKKK